jgi:hypothetical protein
LIGIEFALVFAKASTCTRGIYGRFLKLVPVFKSLLSVSGVLATSQEYL